ncbi:hypothetical protein GGD50_005885 [Rhizobium paranaense]|uniref:Uncharacterized protein n=1 Tax=Rhizobium paranaense TaxID=1650438 RepID=A0A7W9D4C7_9HYPH|nr:hypothetical protein [Rhizobium paranaense]
MYWRGGQGHLKARQTSGLFSCDKISPGNRADCNKAWRLLAYGAKKDNLLRHLNDNSFAERRKTTDNA